MADHREIKVIPQGASSVILRRDQMSRLERDDKRRQEIKKIKDELLTLARRLAEIEKEEAA